MSTKSVQNEARFPKTSPRVTLRGERPCGELTDLPAPPVHCGRQSTRKIFTTLLPWYVYTTPLKTPSIVKYVAALPCPIFMAAQDLIAPLFTIDASEKIVITNNKVVACPALCTITKTYE